MTYRPLLTRFHKPGLHWVGDGFETQSMLPYQSHAKATSPFLIAGYNPPRWFEPTDQPRGVGMHPHRGFETVTVVFQGGVAHGDTMGNHGEIGPGGVQWMTAGRGVQHEEFHSDAVRREGGTLEMVQLWVNLPQKDRMTAPRYQDLTSEQIPAVELEGGARLRIIAGTAEGTSGPVETFSPLLLLDLMLPAGTGYVTDLPRGWSQSLLLLSGALKVNDQEPVTGTSTLIYSQDEGCVEMKATENAHLLILGGEALNEPLVMGGPFVAGSEAELNRAYADFRRGLF